MIKTILLLIACTLKEINCHEIQLKYISEAFTGKGHARLQCSYEFKTYAVVFEVLIQANLSGQYRNIATFYPPNIGTKSTLLPSGAYLTGRVKLTNPSASSRTAVIIFNAIKSEDEMEYKCIVKAYFGAGTRTLESQPLLLEINNAACSLTSALTSSSWMDQTNAFTLTFGASTMAGFNLNARGSFLNDYTCISNTDNVYVFRSDSTYSDLGFDRYIYICMRLTKVTDNLYYYYLMNDVDTVTTFRVYNPAFGAIPPDTDPTCSYCPFTTAPPNSTSESFTGTASLCLPCTSPESSCTATTTSTTTTTSTQSTTSQTITPAPASTAQSAADTSSGNPSSFQTSTRILFSPATDSTDFTFQVRQILLSAFIGVLGIHMWKIFVNSLRLRTEFPLLDDLDDYYKRL